MRNILLILILLSFGHASAQKIVFSYKKTPVESGLKMDDHWVWGGSAIRAGNEYHLFASRWKKDGPFPEGYRKGSEIVRATSRSPLGPFVFKEVIIGERDSSFWDSNMAHNPSIYKIGDDYVLFYIGSDFTTLNERNKTPLRRVGYATSKSIKGPWKRCDQPVIDAESNNPTILIDGDKIKMLYRDLDLKIWLAEANSYKGPYKVLNENVWPESRLEDFYMFKSRDLYHFICEDNEGKVSGHVRWGVHLVSEDGVTGWKKYDPVVVYDHDIVLENDSVLHCIRRERPQLLILKNKIKYLYTGVYDGNNSWCQPVELKKPIRLR